MSAGVRMAWTRRRKGKGEEGKRHSADSDFTHKEKSARDEKNGEERRKRIERESDFDGQQARLPSNVDGGEYSLTSMSGMEGGKPRV